MKFSKFTSIQELCSCYMTDYRLTLISRWTFSVESYNTPTCNVLPDILQNDLTGEHSCIMLHLLSDEDAEDGQDKKEDSWLYAFWKGMYMLPFVGNQGNIRNLFWFEFCEIFEFYFFYFLVTDFRRRFVSLLAYQFKNFTPSMSLSILEQKQFKSRKTSR